MEAHAYWAAAEAGTQIAILAWYVLKKQYLIFSLHFPFTLFNPRMLGAIAMIQALRTTAKRFRDLPDFRYSPIFIEI